MIYAPIYKDIYYQTSASTFEYTIRLLGVDDDTSIVFSGKAVKSPKSDLLYINISKLCRDWLENKMEDFREAESEVFTHPDAFLEFGLFSGELELETYGFLYCFEGEWSGENCCLSSPITGRADSRMKLFLTEYNGESE